MLLQRLQAVGAASDALLLLLPPPPQGRGFMTYNRQPLPYRPVVERLEDWKEVHAAVPAPERAPLLHTQAARCMECGTPFCHQNATGARWPALRSLPLTSCCMLCSAGPRMCAAQVAAAGARSWCN